jgi:oligopeptide/dipeptide ABC transporter ATP-binding protein
MTEAAKTETENVARHGRLNTPPNPLLDVRNLSISFRTVSGTVPVLDRVSLIVPRGKVVALVGESGCGKSVTALSITRLIPQPPAQIDDGQVLLAEPPALEQYQQKANTPPRSAEPLDLLRLTERRMRQVRGNRIAMVFQDPMTSLNPVYTVGEQIVEAIELHRSLRGRTARDLAVEMLRKVGIAAPQQRARDYPHRLSGGMQQRVMIAMALGCEPDLLIADEPTTALDVTIQLQILELLAQLQAETGMGLLIITHDLGVVSEIADEVYVMYAGRIVEHGPVRSVLDDPLHPYTCGLLRCAPNLSQPDERLFVIPGRVPDPADWPPGCRFHPRCALCSERARERRRAVVPVESPVGGFALRRCVQSYPEEPSGRPGLREMRPDHEVACWEITAH